MLVLVVQYLEQQHRDTDYTIASGSIQISEGQLSGTRTFSSTEDNIYEGNETATLTIQDRWWRRITCSGKW